MTPNHRRPQPGGQGRTDEQFAGSESEARIPAQRAPVQLPLALFADDVITPETRALISAHTPTNPCWWNDFHAAVEQLAKSGRTFSADNVRPFGIGEPNHPNMWGIGFGAAARRGVIQKVGAGQSARKSRRNGMSTLWQGTPTWREPVAS